MVTHLSGPEALGRFPLAILAIIAQLRSKVPYLSQAFVA